MNKLSNEFKTQCCGTTCDKTLMANKIRELELRCIDLQNEVDEYNALRANKEAFAKRCFDAGMLAVEIRGNTTYCDIKHWLNFRLEIGL